MLRRSDAGEHQQLRRVERAAGEDDLARAAVLLLLVVRGLRRVRIGAIEIHPLPALHAHGAFVVVEDHPGGQVVHPEEQPVGILLLRIADELPRAVADAVRRGQRDGEGDAFERGLVALVVRIVADQEPVDEAVEHRPDSAEVAGGAEQRREDGLPHIAVGESDRRIDRARAQPSVESVSGLRPHPVLASLQALPVAPHVVGVPRLVVGAAGDVVPVDVVRDDGDHGVVRGAAAERAGARIEHAAVLLAVLLVALLVFLVVVHVVIPRHLLLLAGEGVERRHAVLVRLRIGARLDQADAKSPQRQIGRKGSAARSGPDNDVVVRFDRVVLRTS